MGNTTTKADLVNVIAHKTGLTKNETESVVDSLFESIIDSLKAGKRIEIRGFGSFNIRYKNLRQARNPRTGEKVTVDPKNKIIVENATVKTFDGVQARRK